MDKGLCCAFEMQGVGGKKGLVCLRQNVRKVHIECELS